MKKNIEKEIEKIYSNIRYLNKIKAIENAEKTYEQHPQLREIDNMISECNAARALEILETGEYKSESDEKRVLLLKRKEYLKGANLPENFDKSRFNCSHCNDTGTDPEDNKKKCKCYPEIAEKLLAENSNMKNLHKYSFDSFDINLFPDKADYEKYKTEISPHRQMKGIYAFIKKFIDNFHLKTNNGMFFIGKPGTGKTFMAGCMANELLKKGVHVIYIAAPELFEKISDYRVMKSSFSPDPTRYDEAITVYNNIMNCELLIIDDLGTETGGPNRQPVLLEILNFRSSIKKKTVISTNLDMKNLASVYDERVLSRIYGEFTVLKFIGDDLRHKLKKENN